MNKRLWIIVSFIVGIAVLMFPFDSVAVPQWQVYVVDQNGRPVSGVAVRQIWNHYSFDQTATDDQEETLLSNTNGFVFFEQRYVRASLAQRFLVRVVDLVKPAIRHSSYGVHASVFLRDHPDQSVEYKDEKAPISTLIIDQ